MENFEIKETYMNSMRIIVSPFKLEIDITGRPKKIIRTTRDRDQFVIGKMKAEKDDEDE